jgi:hypothetical protein
MHSVRWDWTGYACGCLVAAFAYVLASGIHRHCSRYMRWILYVVALLPLGLMFVLPCLLVFCLFACIWPWLCGFLVRGFVK